jgi:hypothetical protein
MLGRIYLAFGTAVLGFYGLSAFNGWEFGNPHRHIVPPGERRPGWVRSHPYHTYHYWHSGYRGGK